MYSRKIDALGRITLPLELRQEVDAREGSSMIMTAQNGSILLVPEAHCCYACGVSVDNVKTFAAVRLCPGCIQKIKDSRF